MTAPYKVHGSVAVITINSTGGGVGGGVFVGSVWIGVVKRF